MMPSLAEIAFQCPLCTGPLIAWVADAGRETDCPHCHQSIAVPAKNVETVNKDTFSEPKGLRRILKEVRDSEWEVMRRKLQEARGKVAKLEGEVRRLEEKSDATGAKPASDGAIDGLRESLETLRAEVIPLREENAEMLRQLIAMRADLDSERQEHKVSRDELARLQSRHTGRRTPLPSLSGVRS